MACSPVHARKLAAYWFVSVGTLALQYAFSIIFVDLLEAFDGSRAATALVGSTCAGVMDMMGYASGVAVARRGERTCGAAGAVISGGALVLASRAGALWHLFVTYGLVLGVGQSLALYSGVVCCNKWFSKRLALASALANTGAGVGPFAMPYLWSALRRAGGWRGGLAGLGAIVFCLLASAAAQLAPPPAAPKDAAAGDAGAPLSRLPGIRRLCRTTFFFGWGFWTPAVHLVRLGLDRGHSRRRSEALLTILGVGALTTRVPVGSLGDRFGRKLVFSLACGVYAATQAAVALFQESYAGLAVFSFLVGSSIGSLLSLVPTLVMDVPEVARCPDALARASGLVCCFLGVGGLAGPVVAGALFDEYGSYVPGFGFGAAMLLGCVAALNAPDPPKEVAFAGA